MNSRPWSASYDPGVPLSLPPVDGPFHAALEAAAASAPGYPALTFFNGTMRYAELNALADAVAAALVRDGLQPGDRVLVALPNCPHLAAICLGAMKAGGVAAPLAGGTAESELVLAVARVAPRFVMVPPSCIHAASMALGDSRATVVAVDPRQDLPLLVRLLDRLGATRRRQRARRSAGAVKWATWLKGAGPPPETAIDPNSPALLLAPGKSGAAGQLFAHRHLVAGAAQLRVWLSDAMSGEETWLQLAPLSTGLGFVAGLGSAMVLRARLSLLPRWDAVEVLDALRYLRPAYVVAGRQASARVAADPELANADLRPVRAWITGELLAAGTARAFDELAGFSLCRGYGPPGVAGLALCNPVNGRQVAGSLGVPVPGVAARLTGASGAPVAMGEIGRLEISGPNVASDGWLTTEVLARMDDAGFVRPVTDSHRASRSGIL